MAPWERRKYRLLQAREFDGEAFASESFQMTPPENLAFISLQATEYQKLTNSKIDKCSAEIEIFSSDNSDCF
jgi:hypothetical protein